MIVYCFRLNKLLQATCFCYECLISNQQADSGQGSGGDTDPIERIEALLEGHHGLLFQVAIVLDLSEDHVGGESLDSVVELVFPESLGGSTHPVVGPAGVHLTVQMLVVLNSGKALLEDRSVEKWVQSVTRDS